jgi:hypothetical protein
MRQRQRQRFLVARGGRCIYCNPHDWRAFREPEERDCMQPCILAPVYTIEASTKREAVAEAKRRHEADALTRRGHSKSGER